MVSRAKEVGPKRYRESAGRYYEDFELGDVYEHRPGRTLSEADNTWFSLLTMNQHPLHIDAAYGAATEFGRPLVNSCLTLAIVTGMSVTSTSRNAVSNLGWEKVRLPAPVFAGDLRAMHPAVTDLGQLDDIVGPSGRAMVERAAESAGPIYASLPTQLIHGDFGFGNILVSRGRVRGIVDFEYSGRDVRAMELAAGLASAIARPSRETLWRHVLRGYLGTLQLDLTEIVALPALAVLHWAVIVVWWSGRSRDGHPFPDGLPAVVDRALVVERWMDARGPELVAEALRAST